MLQLYSLTCGHTFCCSCLQAWFSTELATHVATHSEYSSVLQIPREYRRLLRKCNLQLDYKHLACCQPVTSRPVKLFTVKNIVFAVAEAEAEELHLQGEPVTSSQGGTSRLHEESSFSIYFLAVTDLPEGR
ncbi:uncharacterized protein PHACADRAFT_166029 [Phanerochaete carnosa HHB-10118-sp]|uniref:Zinc finger C3HC4 RING-type domain-containing protein n=1 Tax=Phanerochaete carnosa (strain HHB-10118-sp) TaxID=650164 RepID=K5VXD8_PHACS|nr:uncharacterized protein PHACADRAFT_166029 [Phanerochaete carnosa HHB-10118-sp]EKM51470.1 hypothetical protein PHACADRAFT_166029 [Phanerochaete carnosa HHB-10118-sp]